MALPLNLEPHHLLVKELLILSCGETEIPPNAGEPADFHGGRLIRVRSVNQLNF